MEAEQGNDIGSLEELAPEESVGQEAGFWEQPCVDRALRGLRAAATPVMLLDRSLRIAWSNPAFSGSFATRGVSEDLVRFFAGSLDEERRNALFRATRSPQEGYCWYGRLEKQVREQLTVIGNLLILPLFGEHEEPVAYQGIFSDLSAEHRQMLRSTYLSLLQAARLKDNDTGNHIERVNRYSRRLASAMTGELAGAPVDVDFLENIGFLAAMHDVGKIGTPDDILNKAGALAPWEWEIMKEHTINGAYILASYPNPMARDIALRHHERWGGSGYPHGLAGDLIPLSARIVALADVYDALRMRRAYKAEMGHDEAVAHIVEQRGRQFDPRLVDRFREIAEDFRQIYEELGEELATGTQGSPAPESHGT